MSNLAGEINSLVDDFLKRIRSVRDASIAEDAALAAERGRIEKEINETRAEIGNLRIALEAAERNKERFRFALYVYLQERDGLLGVHAPSLSTLNRIRELLEEPLDS